MQRKNSIENNIGNDEDIGKIEKRSRIMGKEGTNDESREDDDDGAA